MNKYISFLSLVICFSSLISCQSQCNLKGDWYVRNQLMFENYEQASPYQDNRITFHDGNVELASGFFYLTDDLVDNFPKGRFPFVYYGNRESYKISGDSIYINSTPYKKLRSFKITCKSDSEVRLIGAEDTLMLSKAKFNLEKRSYSIKQIKAQVDGGGNDLFQINYKVTFLNDDRLIFEDWDSSTKKFTLKEFRLKTGTFKNISQGFDSVDLLSVKELYPDNISESIGAKVEITLTDGRVIRTELRNSAYPDELRLALIPVLFTHQQLVYGNLPAVR